MPVIEPVIFAMGSIAFRQQFVMKLALGQLGIRQEFLELPSGTS